MPTENRSSKTEMVSVPRHIGKEPLTGSFYTAECTRCGWVGSSGELTDDAQCTRIEGDSMCLGDTDEIGTDRLLGIVQAMTQPTEPFAWIGDYAACGGGKAVFDREKAEKITDRMCVITPVYTRANPGEVERLKQELRVARAQGRAEVVEMIIALEAETGLDEFIGSHQIGCTGEWGSHWKEDDLRNHFDVDPAAAGELERYRHSGYEIILLEEERDNLSAQLAKRDALLRRCLMAVREQRCDEDEADFDLPANLMTEIDVALDGKS